MQLQPLGIFLILTHLTTLAIAKHHVSDVYWVRHGEKPSDGSDGLNHKGVQRSLCLVDVFDEHSNYDIGYIIAPKPLHDGGGWRSLDTVTPLAHKLGIDVDTSCRRDNHRCVAKLIKKHQRKGKGNVLVAWQHDGLHGIAREMGYWFPPQCSTRDYHNVWKFPKHVDDRFHAESQCCPKLDKCKHKKFDLQEQL